MNIACLYCSTPYLLPDSLLGTAGARVRCPSCGQRFRVNSRGTVSADEGPVSGLSAAPVTPAAPAAAAAGPHDVAREVVGDLVAKHGAELSDAVGRKELFARHGADVLAAFDEYRRRAGDAAGSEPFRVELRERLGVDLMPRVER